ncbi:hypothetical protein [Sphingobium sp.]|uniref:hypothetical protein n=1 Tax=Sphingobium sp. TaxID=1912891 RepID=UPI0026214750|nr:hypothetical protein [Sphingobium sp.]
MRAIRTDYRALPAERGHVILYRLAETNHCPGCGGSHWLVGRQSAECARCATAIPLMSPATPGPSLEG